MQSSECQCKHTVEELYFRHEFAHSDVIETQRQNRITDGNASATQRRMGQEVTLQGRHTFENTARLLGQKHLQTHFNSITLKLHST